MTVDRAFIERNRASTARIHDLAMRLTDDELRRPLGEHWTVAMAFAHLAFWDRRALAVLDATEREGKVTAPEIDISVNDLSLPLWAAIPPRIATQIAIETAELLDRRLETFPLELLETIYAVNPRWLERALHRNSHLDEVTTLVNLTP
jgi:Mycothiol maleylpyruvate isomerase N-terminal domain